MRSIPVFLAALLMVAALSGCIGEEDAVVDDTQETDEGLVAKTSGSTGSIEGRVLSIALLPMAEVTVKATKGDVEAGDAETDADGHYVINGLAPGEYFLTFSAAGYRDTTQAVQVTAAEVTPKDVRLAELSDFEAKVPTIVKGEFTGFIACGTGVAVEGTPRVNQSDPSQSTTDGRSSMSTSPCIFDTNNDNLDELIWDQGLQELVIGVTWEPVGGVSGESLSLKIAGPECGIRYDDTYCYGTMQGPPGFVWSQNVGDHHEKLDSPYRFESMNNTEENRTMSLIMFPGSEQVPSPIWQQPYMIFWEAYYFQDAPEGRNPIPEA